VTGDDIAHKEKAPPKQGQSYRRFLVTA